MGRKIIEKVVQKMIDEVVKKVDKTMGQMWLKKWSENIINESNNKYIHGEKEKSKR